MGLTRLLVLLNSVFNQDASCFFALSDRHRFCTCLRKAQKRLDRSESYCDQIFGVCCLPEQQQKDVQFYLMVSNPKTLPSTPRTWQLPLPWLPSIGLRAYQGPAGLGYPPAVARCYTPLLREHRVLWTIERIAGAHTCYQETSDGA